MIFECCSEYRPKSRKAGWAGTQTGRQINWHTHRLSTLMHNPTNSKEAHPRVEPPITWSRMTVTTDRQGATKLHR